jgi:hypothetical protein
MLSKKSLELLQAMVAENSNIQIPAGLAYQVLEIRQWVVEELNKDKPKDKNPY